MAIAWKQASATRWERHLTGMEDYLVETGRASLELYDGRQQYNIFSEVRVEIIVPDVESAMRQAWKQLRYEQPAIAATLGGDRKVYKSPDEAALEEWIKSTFIVSDRTDTDTLTSKPIRQATLYYLPATSELHCFMKALASPHPNVLFGHEHVRLLAPHDEALAYTGSPTAKQSLDTTAMITGYLQSLPGIGLPSEIGKAPAGACRNREHIFSKDTTADIIAACMEKKVSVTSAVHAAYVCAVAVYYVRIPFTMDLPSSYRAIARALHEHYQTTLKGSPQTVALTPHYCHSISALAKTEQFKFAPPVTDGFLSSLGVVEKHLHREYGETVKVTDFKLGLDVVFGTSGFLFYTFDEQLRFVYSFNDGYENPEKVREYLEDVYRILREELLGSTL
ncbi:hypothetical protein BJX65DRAFT_298500 [Aspergillus insuetus]